MPPTLPLPLVLALVLTLSSAQTELPLTNGASSITLKIPLKQNRTVSIPLPRTDATLRLGWNTTDRTAFPSTLLFLSDTRDSPLRTDKLSIDHNPKAANRTCSEIRPCATVPTIDFAAFFTRSPRSFLRFLVSPSSPPKVYVTVVNYDTAASSSIDPPPPDILSGVLSARLISDEKEDCPGGESSSDRVCTGNGECKDRRCECEDSFEGRACETGVIALPFTNEPPNEKFLTEPHPESYTARVDLFSRVVFSAKVREGECIRWSVRLLRGFIKDNDADESVQAPRIVESRAPPVIGEPLFNENLTLPTLGKENNTALDIMIENPPSSRCLDVSQVIYIAFYAVPSSEDMTDGFALVNVNMTTCQIGECNPNARDVTLELALVPAFLVTTAVAAIGVLVMLYLDGRRHGFTNHVDRLSDAEIERMYPKTEYSGEPLQCSICLCEMEGGDVVRKLHCNHIYHSECLDPWLTENRASCPTCRTDVRVEPLSDKRHMRRIIRFIFSPLISLRRSRERRSGPDLTEDPPPDLEAADTGQTLVPEPNDEPNDDNNTNNSDRENADTTAP